MEKLQLDFPPSSFDLFSHTLRAYKTSTNIMYYVEKAIVQRYHIEKPKKKTITVYSSPTEKPYRDTEKSVKTDDNRTDKKNV